MNSIATQYYYHLIYFNISDKIPLIDQKNLKNFFFISTLNFDFDFNLIPFILPNEN